MDIFPMMAAVFVAGLFGSLHCVGMCGPLAVMASSATRPGVARTPALFAYHGGRVVAYGILGLIAGLIGSGIQDTGALLGIQRAAARIAGGMMLIVGLLSLVQLISGQQHKPWLPRFFENALHRGHRWARQQTLLKKAAVVGVLTAILPCGWLYSFLLVAAATASVWQGAVVMAAFALGAIPALAIVSLGTNSIAQRFGKAVPVGSAMLVASIGLYTLMRRADLDVVPRVSAMDTSAVNLIRQATEAEPPCCTEE
jgi:uncharacterized protein